MCVLWGDRVVVCLCVVVCVCVCVCVGRNWSDATVPSEGSMDLRDTRTVRVAT